MARNYSIGEKIKGDYLVTDIKEGGLGRVYIAKSISKGHPLAIKTFKQTEGFDAESVHKKLILEFNNWMNFTYHKNIVRCLFLDYISEMPFIGLELIRPNPFEASKGVSLAEWLSNSTVSLADSIKFCLEVCEGLVHLRNNYSNFVHQDLKPSNILINEVGDAKITDFGLSSVKKGITGRGGTPLYMAPEQWEQSELDERSDVYAIGMILYELINGKHLIYEKGPINSIDEVRKSHLGQHIRNITSRNFFSKVHSFSREIENANSQRFYRDPLRSTETEYFSTALASLIKASIEVDISNRYDLDTFQNELKKLYSRVASKLGNVPEGNSVGFFDLDRKIYESDEAWNNRAAAEEFQGNLDLAEEYYTKSIEINPKYYRAWTNRGALKFKSGRIDEAMKDLEEAVRLNDENDHIPYSMYAAILATKERFNEALKYYSKAIKYSGANTVALEGRAGLFLQLNRYEDALNDYQSAIELDSRNIGLYRSKAAIYKERKLYKEALKEYEVALIIEPSNQLVLREKKEIEGKVSVKSGPSLEELDNAISADPTNLQVHVDKAVYFQKNGDIKSEFMAYLDALKYLPKNVDLHSYLASILLEVGDYKEALHFANKALKIDPTHIPTLTRRVSINEKLERYEDMLNDGSIIIELNPKYQNAYFNRACAYSNLGRYKEAIEDYQNHLRTSPDDHQALYNLSNAYFSSGLIDQAFEGYQRLTDFYPGDGLYHAAYAYAALNSGQLNLAKDIIRIALEKFPNNPNVIQIYEQVYKT